MADYSSEEDWRIARRGLSLFLNNKPEEAEILFSLRSNSFHTKTARCFVLFMNALMTFEDEKLVAAVETLKNTERECASDVGWLKSITSRVFKTEQDVTASSGFQSEYARRLERQIVLADTKVCSALLTLLQQEVSGYVRGGWMMRKAWRIYQHTYLQILQLYRRTFGTNPTGLSDEDIDLERLNVSEQETRPPRRCRSSSSCSVASSFNDSPIGTSRSSPTSNVASPSSSSLRTSISMLFSLTGITGPSSTDQQTSFVEPSEVVRLMSAVSFGYGIFQLCVSLVPPSLLKLIHFLGFEGDRKAGVTALMYARLSEDMRAPLATLSLLCYHTIVRPFCSLHDWSVSSGVDAAKQLIAECKTEFNDAALFLFFTGRTERLQSNIEAALEAYGKAVEASAQREMKLLCLHEVAWCHLIRLNYYQAHVSFARLQRESRWCECIYSYLAAVCAGADDKTESILRIHREITTTLSGNGTSKSAQLDLFVLRRVSKLVDKDGRVYSPSYYRLLVFELLYLWNALPSSSRESLSSVISECREFDRNKEEPMIGLADLVAGAAHSYRGDSVAAIKSYRKCIEKRRKENTNIGGDESATDHVDHPLDQHVSAFALYELGSILCLTGKTEEGKSALIKAQTEYSDYDFENRLKVRIHMALKTLAR